MKDFSYELAAAPAFADGERWHLTADTAADPRKAHQLVVAAARDIWHVVMAWTDEPDAYRVHFVVFEASHWGDAGAFEIESVDADTSEDTTRDLGRAAWVAHGTVKWDGCVDYANEPTDRCYAHCCGMHAFVNRAQAWRLVYHLAARLMPSNYEIDGGGVTEVLGA